MARATTPAVKGLAALVGEWTTEATHPLFPGTVVHGAASIAWFEGETFLVVRASTDHPDFPDSIAIIGDTAHDRADPGAPPVEGPHGLRMFYFDERGVHRIYETKVSAAAWEYWRMAPGFSQRFTGTFADGGNTIDGRSQLCKDGKTWDDDLRITYRRVRS
jgi:hypothetical protein